ncbi:DUF3558 domain-containing protein [Nocardia blacklockiae]|uniref:DUF3558 domain-containing protein n=1 Tax=Nocardia blacklockiae TaxID=480036 RepID=UPI0018933F9F|nr:DUF3558 domain-containing protein [Nocardia blacklockiae]MBF6174657.1 DUF3558 domain-containing protein [Nocardia blacklockiae]
MISRGPVTTTLATITALAFLTGCGSSTNGDPQPTGTATDTGSTLAADVPRGYDPCNGVPQAVLDSEKLHGKENADNQASGGIKWRGCMWVRSNGYTVSIRTTNLTIDAIHGKNFPETQDLQVGGRKAVSSRQFDGPSMNEACTLNTELRGGTLEFNVDNPPSNPDTGRLDACQIARTLAEKVLPSVPATA